jgi:hypothetical protein
MAENKTMAMRAYERLEVRLTKLAKAKKDDIDKEEFSLPEIQGSENMSTDGMALRSVLIKINDPAKIFDLDKMLKTIFEYEFELGYNINTQGLFTKDVIKQIKLAEKQLSKQCDAFNKAKNKRKDAVDELLDSTLDSVIFEESPDLEKLLKKFQSDLKKY